MHRTYIADIERGGRNLTLKSIESLASALQIPISSVFVHTRARDAGEPEADRQHATMFGEVLLVEDNPADVELTLRAFRRAGLSNPVKVVTDGEEALDYLFRAGRYAKRRTAAQPQLILLDLNLPKLSGIDVLRRIKADEQTRNIAVVVLTVSRQDRTIIECSQLGAANYILKPLGFDSLCKVAPKLDLRWALLRPSGAPMEIAGPVKTTDR